MNAWTLRDWSKWIFTSVGGVMFTTSAALWLLRGFSFHRLIFAVTGLLFLALGLMGKRAVKVYKDIAIILLNTVLLLIILEGASALVLRFVARSDDGSDGEAPAYYKTQDWGEGYVRDITKANRRHYVPYVIWKNDPFTGEYVNVDHDGNRVTPGVRCASNSYVVFMFGGSTMWGAGAPDWGTIPAYFQTELSRLGDRPVCVRNFGQMGWVSTQSVIELLRHLQAGEVPDLVIFYDGFNEVLFPVEEGVPGAHQDLAQVRRRLEEQGTTNPFSELAARTSIFGLMQHSVRSPSSQSSARDQPRFETATMGTAVVKAYLTNYRGVKALAGQFGFDYAFFWQPNLVYEQKPLTQEEKSILGKRSEGLSSLRELMVTVYPQIQEATRNLDHLFFFGDTFKNESEWLYIDKAHLTPGGNQEVAKRMVETLRNNHHLRDTDLRLSSISNR